MITFKTSNNENDNTVSIAEVDNDNDNDAAHVAPIDEENTDINFLANQYIVAQIQKMILQKD